MTGDQRLARGSAAGHGDTTRWLVDHLPALFCLSRARDGALLHWNRQLAAFTGHAADALADRPFSDLLHRDDTETARHAGDRALRDGRADCEARILAADGAAPLHHIAVHALDWAGEPCLCLLGFDLSARASAEAESDRTRAQLAAALESNADGVACFDAHDRLVLFNERYRDLVAAGDCLEIGTRYETILRRCIERGDPPSALAAPEDWIAARQRERRSTGSDSREEQLADGRWVRVHERPTRDGGTVAVRADITALKAREQSLRDNEARYRALFEGAREAILLSDGTTGRIVDANGPAERLFGHPRTHLIGQPYRQFFPHAAHPPADDRGPRGATVIAGDGQRTPVEIETVLLHDHAGRRLAQTRLRDLSEVHQRERETAERYHILELIARATPLQTLAAEIAGMVERQCPGLRVAILVRDERGLRPPDAHEPALDTTLFESGDADSATGCAGVALPGGLDTLWDSDPPRGPLRGIPVTDANATLLGALVFGCDEADASPERADRVRACLAEAVRLTAIAIEQDQLANRLNHQAHHDPLTGLPNRSLLMDRVEHAMAGAPRQGEALALVMLDLDDFKRVNDDLGHAAGDQLLQTVALKLQDCLRGDDTVARLGGDEFVLLLPRADTEQAARVAEKVLRVLEAPIRIAEQTLTNGASIGIALFPSDATAPATLLQAADTAMYAAKQAGRNGYRFFTETTNQTVTERLRLESDLRQALEQGKLAVHYQPRVCPADGRVIGTEALARWQHPVHGLLQPGDFLGICEQARLNSRLDAWMLEQTAKQAGAWIAAGHDWGVSLNISPATVQEAGFVDTLVRALERSGVAPSAVELEIPENGLMRNPEHAAAQIERLRGAAPGLRIALDDFGRGYASLVHLRDLALDTLKIDRRLVQDLTRPGVARETRALLESILAVAGNLGLDVVAEGIETAEQHRAILDLGCRAAQGFYYAAPLTATELEACAATPRAP